MNIPKLQVQTTQARLGHQVEAPRQTIRQPKAELSIQQPAAEMNIRQHPGKLTIDQTKAWNNIDLKSVSKRSDELAADGRQLLLEGIARMAREGDELMKIEDGGNPIASHGAENAKLDFTFAPGGQPVYDLVDVSYEAAPVDIDIEPQKPVIQAQRQKPQHTYQPGKVSFQLEQYPDVQIDWKV
ncbi:hypothetical protein GLW04_13660 [Halobacillus litoralis]|uniref:Uncharacterized protein n=1 Tax=Halobacillus litoralis TaxID=45668 RepID=A0A845DWW1_9BACI|nr:DUF6470 family protein [Halobacillus litoralis]MYL20945.1 hypothetical protein [Halobacillus litoralis]